LRRPAVSGGAKSGAVAALVDPDLAYLLDAWPALPPHIGAAELALVRTVVK
jgi:hypothetical protein